MSSFFYSRLLLLIFLVFTVSISYSQEETTEAKSNYLAGVALSHASAELLSDNSANYTYRSVLIKFPMAKELKRSKHWSIYLDLVPQLNFGEFSEENMYEDTDDNFEFGASLGVSFHRRLKFVSMYLAIQLGPHYINKTPEFQSSGFIFSDTGEVGLLFNLRNDYLLRCAFAYRHLSNASLTDKNRGIDNLIGTVGLSKSF